MAKYIIRLDDFALNIPTENWIKIFKILELYNIKPIVGFIPKNKDKKLQKGAEVNSASFLLNSVKSSYVAIHGYDHVYITKESGLVPMNNNSEFAGLSYDQQKEKILNGLNILSRHNISAQIWMAPSHSFDYTTLEVLKKETSIRIITDGVAFFPYEENGFLWIPQQLWKPLWKLFGVWTICYHPNEMKLNDFENLENFIEKNRAKIICDFEELVQKYRGRRKSILDIAYCKYFFVRRYLEKKLL